MNKGLEALNEIINKFIEILLAANNEKPTAASISSLSTTLHLIFHDELDIIETEFNRLDDLRQMLYKMNVKHGYKEYLKIIKALKVIKKYIHVIKMGNAYYICLNDEMELISKEEYDLLEEVFL